MVTEQSSSGDKNDGAAIVDGWKANFGCIEPDFTFAQIEHESPVSRVGGMHNEENCRGGTKRACQAAAFVRNAEGLCSATPLQSSSDRQLLDLIVRVLGVEDLSLLRAFLDDLALEGWGQIGLADGGDLAEPPQISFIAAAEEQAVILRLMLASGLMGNEQERNRIEKLKANR